MQNSDRFLEQHVNISVPSLIDETAYRIILYRGYNDVNSKNSTPGKTANKIGDMAILSPSYGVNDIYISAMICRCKFLNEKVKRINFLLKLICEENGYFFIDNSNIEIRHLAQSFIYFLNNSYWLSPYNNFLEAHTHTHTGILNLYT